MQLFTNQARSTLAGAIADDDLLLTVAAGTGARFPAPTGDEFFKVTLKTSSAREIVKVTSVAGDVFTIVRAQEDTTALNWASGVDVREHLTAGAITDIVTGLAAKAPLASPALTGTPTAPTAAH